MPVRAYRHCIISRDMGLVLIFLTSPLLPPPVQQQKPFKLRHLALSDNTYQLQATLPRRGNRTVSFGLFSMCLHLLYSTPVTCTARGRLYDTRLTIYLLANKWRVCQYLRQSSCLLRGEIGSSPKVLSALSVLLLFALSPRLHFSSLFC